MFLMSAALLIGLQELPRPQPARLRVAAGCHIRVDGKGIELSELDEQAQQWVADKRDLDMRIAGSAGPACMNAVMRVLWPYKEYFPGAFNAENTQ